MSVRRGRGVELTRAELERMSGASTMVLELADVTPPSATAAALRRLKKQAREEQWKADVALLRMRLKVRGAPMPVEELEFALPVRGWRFDLAWPEAKLALEVDGGAYVGGRHTSGAGFEEDQIKRNAALLLGWRVLHVLPKHLNSGSTISLITNALEVIQTGEASPYFAEYAQCQKKGRRQGTTRAVRRGR